MIEDFPEPEGPTKATWDCAGILKETLLKTFPSLSGYLKETFSKVISP